MPEHIFCVSGDLHLMGVSIEWEKIHIVFIIRNPNGIWIPKDNYWTRIESVLKFSPDLSSFLNSLLFT